MPNQQTAVEDVTLKEAFDIYQKQSDSAHKLWAYFQVVSLAFLGYTVGSNKSLWGDWTYVLAALSYVLFASATQWVIVLSQRELKRFGESVAVASSRSGPIGRGLAVKAVSPWKVRAFHSVSAIVVVVAIAATWYDKCRKNVCPSTATSEQKDSK